MHGLIAVHIDGRWARLDPRGNKPGVDARYDLVEERLAFPTDPAQGEIDYPTVYPASPPSVLAALAAGKPTVAGYAYLPAELPT